jgi:hypothetical protein
MYVEKCQYICMYIKSVYVGKANRRRNFSHVLRFKTIYIQQVLHANNLLTAFALHMKIQVKNVKSEHCVKTLYI